jgi:site-specific DNA-adenine methylase
MRDAISEEVRADLALHTRSSLAAWSQTVRPHGTREIIDHSYDRTTEDDAMLVNQIPLFETDGSNYLVKSPLNYVGGKFRLLNQVYDTNTSLANGKIVEKARLIPAQVRTFVDACCGGFNIGANAQAERIIGIDLDRDVIELLSWIKDTPTLEALHAIHQIIKRYGLGVMGDPEIEPSGRAKTMRLAALVAVDAEKPLVLGDGESELSDDPYERSFYALRTRYNKARLRGKRSIDEFDIRAVLFTLIAHAFNAHIRFSTKGYNVPYGKRTFNGRQIRNFEEFSRRLRSTDTTFHLGPFSDIESMDLDSRDYVYVDPPYLISTAPYNENLCWEEEDDIELYSMLDRLHAKGVRFGLSNVLRHKGRENEILRTWAKRYHLRVLDFNYCKASYQLKKEHDKTTTEVFVTNCISLGTI